MGEEETMEKFEPEEKAEVLRKMEYATTVLRRLRKDGIADEEVAERCCERLFARFDGISRNEVLLLYFAGVQLAPLAEREEQLKHGTICFEEEPDF
jgi:hypothetical protein